MYSSPLDPIFNIISNITLVLMRFAAAYFIVRLYISFLKDNSVKKKMWIAGAAYFCMINILSFTEILNPNSISHIISVVAAFLIYYFLDRGNVCLKTYITISFFVVTWMARFITINITSYIINFIGDHAVNFITDNPEKFTVEQVHTWFIVEYAIQSILHIVIITFILWFFVKKFTDIYETKKKDLSIRELVLLLIPSLVGVASFCLDTAYSYSYEQMHNYMFFGIKAAGVLWVLFFTVQIAAIITTASFYQQIERNRLAETHELMLESSVKDIQEHIKEIENIYSHMRGIRHDINNHVGVLMGLLEQGNTGDALEYMKQFQNIADMSELTIKTGNPITDVVINEKMKEAEPIGVEFKSDFHYPTDSGLNAFDVSIVLSNALSNAAEAVENSGFISVSSFRNKNIFLITVTNSFKGTLVLSDETGFPKTTKTDGKLHGIGLQNIKMVAEKYFGDVKLEQKEDTVTLTVMLKVQD